MSVTFKILLDTRKASKNGQYPIKLRVYGDGSYKDLFLNIKIAQTDWNERQQEVLQTNTEYLIYNAKISDVKSKANKVILLADIEGKQLQPIEIVNALTTQPTKTLSKSIIKYGEEYVKLLQTTGKIGNSIVYSCAINKLKSFVKNDNFSFEDLTYKKLQEFSESMAIEGITINGISVYMRTIRALYNKAIKENIVNAALYPFTAYKIKNEKTRSRTLTLEELRSIAKLQLQQETPIWHWRNYFLLSFCFVGMNFADLLTLSTTNIENGRIIFRRKKTGKIYSIKISIEADRLLNFYRNKAGKGILLLPVIKQTQDLLKLKKDITQAIKTCNEYLERLSLLCNIDKNITTYYARYSWANIAKALGYSKDLIAEALGHEYGNKVTGIYLDSYSNEVIDEANQTVINAIFS